jgi:hypothetical protein
MNTGHPTFGDPEGPSVTLITRLLRVPFGVVNEIGWMPGPATPATTAELVHTVATPVVSELNDVGELASR